MVLQHTRSLEGQSSRNTISDYASIASSADNVPTCLLCLVRSHRSFTCPPRNGQTQNLIIKLSKVHLAAPLPKNLTPADSRGPGLNVRPTPTLSTLSNKVERAIADPPKIVIVQKTSVPGEVAKSHCRRERPLLYHLGPLHQHRLDRCHRKPCWKEQVDGNLRINIPSTWWGVQTQ